MEPSRNHEKNTSTPPDGPHNYHSHRKEKTQSIHQNTVSQERHGIDQHEQNLE
jgi:hypothetical protein